MKYLIILILIITISCEKTVKTYYQNGNIKEIYHIKQKKMNGAYLSYYLNGNKNELSYYKNGVKIDSSILYRENEKNELKRIIYYNFKKDTFFVKDFFSNNRLKGKGFQLKNGNKIGFWSFNNYEGYIQRRAEFLNLNGREYANRTYEYDAKGKLLMGNYFEFIDVKDTVRKDETFPFTIYLSAPFFSYDSELSMIIPSDELIDMKNIISNREKIKFDTIRYENNVSNLIVRLDLEFSKVGKNTLSGIIIEKCTHDIDSLTPSGTIRELYFEKTFIVN